MGAGAAALSIWGATAGENFLLSNDFIFTFFLVFVVLHCATASNNLPNQFYGAAICGVVFAGRGIMNPALAIGFFIFPDTNMVRCTIPLLVPYLGGAFAALVFRLTSPKDFGGDLC